jgi:hypothetical protein
MLPPRWRLVFSCVPFFTLFLSSAQTYQFHSVTFIANNVWQMQEVSSVAKLDTLSSDTGHLPKAEGKLTCPMLALLVARCWLLTIPRFCAIFDLPAHDVPVNMCLILLFYLFFYVFTIKNYCLLDRMAKSRWDNDILSCDCWEQCRKRHCAIRLNLFLSFASGQRARNSPTPRLGGGTPIVLKCFILYSFSLLSLFYFLIYSSVLFVFRICLLIFKTDKDGSFVMAQKLLILSKGNCRRNYVNGAHNRASFTPQ